MAKVYGGRWETVSDLGTGGQAHVYRVKDLQSPEEYYALKRLRDDRRVGRLENELTALQQIDHPNVVRLIDHHVSGHPPYYLVTELMEGGTLADRVKKYKGDIVRSLGLFCGICDGVAAAHRQNPAVIHRDLKPENVLFRAPEDENPVVTDFGLCWVQGGERFTASQEHVGTLHFMAPELEDGRVDKPTAELDIYSLGKLLYYIVSGGIRFSREKHREPRYDLERKFGRDSADPLQDAQLEYVSGLLDGMLTLDPMERYTNVSEVSGMARHIQRLVRDGHYPLTSNMPCKFCGEGVYQRHGPENAAITIRGFASDLSVAALKCNRCGHMQLFDWHTHEQYRRAVEGPESP